jgi:formate dehydrogenase subunit gamma
VTTDPQGKRFRRFVPVEIITHWVNAVPFVILLISGALMLSSRFWNMDIGLFRTLVLIHKYIGIAWVSLLTLTLFIGPRVHIKNFKEIVFLGTSDLKWMLSAVHAVFNPHVAVHPAGKFNTGQKINSLLFFFYTIIFPVTGFLMWFYGTILISWYAHAAIFFMASGTLGGHLYLSFINPSTRVGLGGIFHGWVPLEYIAHHHSLQLELSAARSPRIRPSMSWAPT